MTTNGTTADHILIGRGVTRRFGGVAAVKEVDFEVEPGEIYGLIGPNGAGKTTLLNCISGVFPVDGGEIRFKGTDISKLKPYRIAQLGIGRTFQVVRPFEGLTVRENVMIGGFFGAKRALNTDKKGVIRLVDEILDFVEMSERVRAARVSELTIIYRKRLEMARALAMQPDILLLDECMAGLNPKEIESTMAMVQKINGEGITVLMIEHVMKAIMGICHRVMVLRNGQKIAVGTPKTICEDEEVIKAYLGQRWADAQAASCPV